MPLAPGSKLGPYEILSPIGAGGMGEVYKASDTRLDRTVAVKVLPEHLSNDPARRERFEREARAVSSLNHSHICTLHDVGEHQGVHFLVMEHLEGETLAARLERGAIPLDKALVIAGEIADALDTAHRAGIVHRDLKPGNVMLTKPGVKLLDFGLAKTHEDTNAASSDSQQPTQNKPLTDAGTILGTVQYMAPEQLEGKDVDARADVFAFGAILYEMLTGRKAFEGGSQASLISAILSAEPPAISEIEPMSPPALDRVVKKCLAKDPDNRWRSTHDVATELAWIHPSIVSESPAATGRRWLPWTVATVAALAAVYFASRPEAEAPDATTPIRFEKDLESPFLTFPPEMALSPDGTHFVYTSGSQGELRVHSFSALTYHVVDENEFANFSFFSSDGRWVGYTSGYQLKKAAVEGGPPEVIGDLLPYPGRGTRCTWGSNGFVLCSNSNGYGLYSYPADGGRYETIVELEPAAGRLSHPRWLPDERHALVTLSRGADSSVQVVDTVSGEMHEVLDQARQASYLPSGHLVYLPVPGTSYLYAVRFDIDRLVAQGTPVALPEQVYSSTGGFFTVSEEGHLAYLPAGTAPATSLLWSDRTGVTTALDIEPGVFRRPSLSPDGQRLAVDSHVGAELEHDIWIFDLQTGTRTRFTFSGHNAAPVWTPDGTRLTFQWLQPPEVDVSSIYWKRIDSAAPPEPLVTMEHRTYPVSWSVDGSRLAFVVQHPDSQEDIWMLPIGAEPAPVLATTFREHSPMISPDDRFLAYVSDESGRDEVYVIPFPDGGSKYTVSTAGGREPMWSRDGKTLFFRSVDGTEMWSVNVELEPTFRADRPENLFAGTFLIDSLRQQTYDVAPDGERFLMIEETEGFSQARAVIVLNWMEEVKRLLPVE